MTPDEVKSLREGERLWVRFQNSWAGQSIVPQNQELADYLHLLNAGLLQPK